MTLVVEYGTGKLNAESYASVEFCDDYASRVRPNDAWIDADDEEKEAALRQATQFMDARYGMRWKGRKYSRDQRLDWPRADVRVDQYTIDIDPLPRQLQEACAEFAQRALVAELDADVADDGMVSSESVTVGPISESKTYLGGKSPVPWYQRPDTILSKLLRQDAGMERG